MGVHSGKFGLVSDSSGTVSTVRNWNITETNDAQEFVASNTKFGTGRRAGPRDWTGTYSAYGAVPANMPGEKFTFTGYTAPTDDANPSSAGQTYSGTAIVDSIAITWNWASGEIIAHVVTFSGDLELIKASGTITLDASDPDTPVVCGTKIEFSVEVAIPAYVEWDDLVSATWTITADNQSYVNSGTFINGVCWTGRKSGPINWTMAVIVENDERGVQTPIIPQIEDSLMIKLYVNATQFWVINFGHVIDYTAITVDRETGSIINATVNLGMDGYHSDGATPPVITEGVITRPLPDGTNYWPDPVAFP